MDVVKLVEKDVKTPDGEILTVRVPATATPEEVFQYIIEQNKPLTQKVAETAKKTAGSMVAGFGKTAAMVPRVASWLMPENAADGFQGLADTADEFWTNFGNTHGHKEGLPKAMSEGAGGAFVSPVGSRGQSALKLVSQMAVPGALGGAGGEIGADLLQTSPQVGGLLGGLAGGLTGGWLLGPKQSVARQDIRRELQGLPDSVFGTAEDNARLFADLGLTTATAADAFPVGQRIRALASRAANSVGGEKLAQKLAGRDDELAGLGQSFLDRIFPPVNPAVVANNLSDAATGFITGQQDLMKAALRNRLQGAKISQDSANALYDNLMWAAEHMNDPQLTPAYREVAQRLVTWATRPDGKPVAQNDVQRLSLQIKGLKQAMKNPLQQTSQANTIDSQWLKEPIGVAETGLAAESPQFRQGMSEYRQFREDPYSNWSLKNIWAGPIGRLADKNPLNGSPTPISRLNALVEGNDPAAISGTARILQNPILTDSPVSAKEVARALYQQKLNKGTTNPGKDIRGLPGSRSEEQLDALLGAARLNPAQVKKPLQAADLLQELRPANSANSLPQMSAWQGVIRPFRTLDMMITAKNEAGIQREIAQLLGDPANLPELRKIAMFNPTVRKALSLVSGVNSALGGFNRAAPEGEQ